jgi:MFS superfamily sulfate permease-like transporter
MSFQTSIFLPRQHIFYPKILTAWKNYTLQQLWKVFCAGIVLDIIAIPLSIAFEIANVVTPLFGEFKLILKSPKIEILVFLAIFLTTLLVNLTGRLGGLMLLFFTVVIAKICHR